MPCSFSKRPGFRGDRSKAVLVKASPKKVECLVGWIMDGTLPGRDPGKPLDRHDVSQRRDRPG